MEVKKLCLFCKQDENNELLYGKIYELNGEIVAHHFCLLLSSNMEQNGGDSEGIQGFLKEDILKEFKRGKRISCCYCKRSGATVGCCMSRCKKVFHLPCGRREGSLHQFSGEFKSYCVSHRPVQKISPDVLMELQDTTTTCAICCEDVDPRNCVSALWAPCCRKNAWFHRDCVQRLALSAGYFFKCPLCNNNKVFRDTMSHFGIYIPEQDASWELVPDAFQELLHRHNRCDANLCVCPKGRSHTMVGTRWELVLCKYCGSQGVHVGCGNLKWSNPSWECDNCTVMLQQAQEGYDTDSDEEPHPSPATVNQIPARRKRRYFKGSGGLRRRKCKRNVINSASPHPSSSQSEVMPKGVPATVTDGPVSPPTPSSVIEVSDEDVIEILDDDGEEPTDKTSTPSGCKTIVSFDGKPIQVTHVATIVATDDKPDICVLGDVDVKLPSYLYDVQQNAKPGASNSGIFHVSGTIVPGSSVNRNTSKSSYSSVDGSISFESLLSSVGSCNSSKPSRSSVDDSISIKSILSPVDSSSPSVYGSTCSKFLDSSVDGSSSYTSVCSSPTISHIQPSISGTARGNLMKSYLTSQNAEVECAHPVRVPTVTQQVDNKTPAGTESQNPNTRSVQCSARTSSHNTAALPSDRVCNRPHGNRCTQQCGSCINTASQQQSRHLGDRLTGHCVQDALDYLVTSPQRMQVDGVSCDVMTIYRPLRPVRNLFQNDVIKAAPAVLHNVISAFININISNQQAPHLNEPEEPTMCSGQEGGVGESYPENWVDYSCSEKGVDDAYLDRGVGDTYSEGEFSESEVGDTYSEGGLSKIEFGDFDSESGLSDADSYIGVEDSQTESQFDCHLPVSYSPIVTRSRSRCLLHSTAHMTRSQIKKMKESRSLSCRCESCGETKKMLGKKDWKVHKDSDSRFSVSEVVRGRCRSGSSSRGIPHTKRRRRSRSLSLNRSTRKFCSSSNNFSPAEIGVPSYSGCDSYSERGVSDTCSVMGLSDTYSEIGVGYSQAGQYDCDLPVASYSPVVTCTGRRCVLNSNTHLTRSVTKKMLGGNDGKVHKDCNSSFSVGEERRGRLRRRAILHRRGRRRTRSLSLNRKTRKQNSNQNTFSLAEIGVRSHSECDFYSERGLSDAFSEIRAGYSQTKGRYDCHLPVTSYSSVVTRSRTRCVLKSNTRLTRSLIKKMQEGRLPSCRCETCREILGKENWKVHTDSKVKLNRNVPHGEAVSRRRCGSVGSCGSVQDRRRIRMRKWGRSTIMHHSIRNSDGSLTLMKQCRDSVQVKNESGIEQGYVTGKINYLNNGMYELDVIGNSQSGVVYNSGIGLSEGTGIDYSRSNVPQHHSSENMKQMCCNNMATGVEGTSLCKMTWNSPAFCGCLNGVIKTEEALSVDESFSLPNKRRMEE